jgi:poly(3-hydroxybutyrate) depolymerase
MARHASGSKALGRMVQQQTRWFMRQAVSEGKKALKRSNLAPASPARHPPLVTRSAGGTWSTGIAAGMAGMRRYKLFTPSGLATSDRHPLVIMLHGCGQSATEFAASTHMNRLAAALGFMLLYPEQDRLANAQACWNWFDTRTGRAKGEAASIVAALDHAHAQAGSASVVQRGKRYPITTMNWLGPKGRLQVTLTEITGLGHAWSGGAASQAYSDPKGPDASRMVWAFALRQFEKAPATSETRAHDWCGESKTG